jgi:hypothetical protein
VIRVLGGIKGSSFLLFDDGMIDESKKRDRLPGCQIQMKGECPGQWNKINLLLVVIGGR